MATIELDGVEYTARKYTNALRHACADIIDRREKAQLAQVRAITEYQRLETRVKAGQLDESDPDRTAAAAKAMGDASDLLVDLAYEAAPKVLVDPEGKPPTKKVLDEHADPDELAGVVARALGEKTPDPTKESTENA